MKKSTNRTLSVARILALMLALALLSGCGQSAASGPAPAVTSAPEGGTPYQIGIVQIVEHGALDAAREGFVAALAENGYTDGKQIALDIQNAQGDMGNLSTICDRFVSNQVDMVLAIATSSAQAMAAKTTEIPILATAVTSYTTAGLVNSDEAPGGNVTGTSDMNPVAAQLALLKEMVPGLKTVGLLYTLSEDNSVLQIKIAKEALAKLGLAAAEATVTSTNDIQQAMQSLVGKCEAVYIPGDNTLASAMPTVHSVALEAKLPVMTGDISMAMSGALVAMGLDYYSLGYQTGLMAIDVINGSDPAAMPIQYPSGSEQIVINALVAKEIGYTVPEQYADKLVMPE